MGDGPGQDGGQEGGEEGAGRPRGERGQAPVGLGRGGLGQLGRIGEWIGRLILDYLATDSNEFKRKLE
jgi:hypothetical protein